MFLLLLMPGSCLHLYVCLCLCLCFALCLCLLVPGDTALAEVKMQLCIVHARPVVTQGVCRALTVVLVLRKVFLMSCFCW